MIPSSLVEQASFISREGYEVGLDDLRWKLSRDVTLGLEWVVDILDEGVRESFVCLIAHYAASFAPGTAVTVSYTFKAFAKHVIDTRGVFEVIRSTDVINYRTHVGEAGDLDLAGSWGWCRVDVEQHDPLGHRRIEWRELA